MHSLTWKQFLHLFDSAVYKEVASEVGSTCDRELRALLNLAFHFQPKRILELYTSEGHTALWLARICASSQVVAIDICSEMNITSGRFNAPHEIKDRARVGRAFLGRPEGERIQLMIKNPTDIDFSALHKFDLVYIDGEHSFEAVLLDTKRALECVSVNGILVWDDYQAACPQVIEFLESLSAATGSMIFRIETSRICFVLLTPFRHEVITAQIRNMIDNQQCVFPKFPRVRKVN